MNVSDFDYTLPDEQIAKYPPKERGTTKLLALNRKTGEVQHSLYRSLDAFLEPGDLLVLNNTKVIKARLQANKPTGASVELLLLEKHEGPQQIVMYGGKIKAGNTLLVGEDEVLVEEILGNGLAKVSAAVPLLSLVEKYGNVPIPPYLNRKAEKSDEMRYQTVFAKEQGSVAAPTASLNFTESLEKKLKEKGVQLAFLTLHVGLGTFMPIRTETLSAHEMHREFYHISHETAAAIRLAKAEKRRVVALGTTVTRAIEHASARLLAHEPAELAGEADIFIYPGGYEFQIVDALLTNFHAPRSTVLMLAAAFAGAAHLKAAYEAALQNDYHFLSYGDSMFIF
ncbi:S-adenosylmethionine/tRNA-ribosyltransferase-isomerase [Chloroherpeton thalassium ATCC 35110]|uniref:S-adenosylmethionine:tRNA ribosyltransferase-isomerase n=1 Tax=Chloroherpeton thalassium (strain ATCC 35110 / GB-78) TaxID=517418 RepID=B3QV33_CHLT3|nr:tRNA preQ1(34) S-adenosylmethionine ribosyltransferase-isomerase QueA [Chloroherpeton thalassium]ACF12987.1 S-adenosylmethionine/tRNA-ribosyltransferase-isomerase [Chloroherpeton thalassium ATCC 35110]